MYGATRNFGLLAKFGLYSQIAREYSVSIHEDVLKQLGYGPEQYWFPFLRDQFALLLLFVFGPKVATIHQVVEFLELLQKIVMSA